MHLSAALRERDWEDFERVQIASQQPNRRDFPDPIDHRLECPLGRLRVSKQISEEEYQAGIRWRNIYSAYLHSIQTEDEEPEEGHYLRARETYERGLFILECEGKRVLHAVNAIVVYEEPEELGDFEFTSAAAKIGLAVLARSF